MHSLSIPCLIMASINFYVATYYAFLYFKRPQISIHLPFVILCLSVGLYDVFCIGLYNSASVVEGVLWQKMQFYIIDIIAISMMWFVHIFTGRKNKNVFRFFTMWFLTVLVVSAFINPEYFISAAKPAIKHIDFMGVFKIDYYEAETGLVCDIEMLSIIVAYIYILYVFFAYYRKTKDGTVFVLIGSFIIYFFGMLNDILVPLRLYSFIYTSEYAFFFIIIAMAYILLNKFADIQTAFEELNANLEKKVEERTAENERIHTQLLQSEKMAAVGQLTSGLAHEINNPVGIIMGFSQGVIKLVKEDDPFYIPLKSIEREATRCKKLVSELLLFSRTGKTYSEKIQVNAIVEETLAFVSAHAKERNIQIEVIKSVNIPEITMNKNQLQQVILNICNNAIDAMPDGGKLLITTRQAKDQVEIEMSDTGTGMTEEVKKHIFEPFFSTKEVGKGSGLGLSICYEIVRKYNGKIDAESKTGKGSVFTLKFPILTEMRE